MMMKYMKYYRQQESHSFHSGCKNGKMKTSGLWDKVFKNVDVLDEVEDDKETFKNELAIEVD